MKVALVHDYLNEFGGAERVLIALSEIFPDAPIYTAFYRPHSPGFEPFKNKDIRVSWAHTYIPFFNTGKLHSPLRFLTPLIWNSFDFSEYDLIIDSSSWYITRGFSKKGKAVEICYCHTPPRWLYGYATSIELQKYWPVRVYALLIGHFLRLYDYFAASRVDYFIANSENIKKRIEKFYRREATVIYPSVSMPEVGVKKGNYYLVLSRIVGGKGLQLAVEAANTLGIHLKVVGASAGYGQEMDRLQKIAGDHVEFLGYVSDETRAELFAGAKAFLALATDEDFGMTPVEAMMVGTPVIAYNGGGYKESVVEGKTGVFFDEATGESLVSAIRKFEKMTFDPIAIKKHAQQFSKETFEKKIRNFVSEVMRKKRKD